MKYYFQEFKKSEIQRDFMHMGRSGEGRDTFGMTNLYLERNGKPWIGTMGEYHFVRDHAENWYEELCKMKAGGIGIVSTYLFWNYHEEDEGIFDFFGDRDIKRFLKEAEKAGLDAVLRIGPWAHGEVRFGGFPDWLMEKGIPLRDNNAEYMSLVKRYWERVYEEVKDCLYCNGGNVIAIQFENELVDCADHILALKQMALEIGFEAPIYTATGWNHAHGAELPLDEVLPVFGGYAEAPWEAHTEKLPPSSHYFFNKMRNDSAIGTDLIAAKHTEGWELPYDRYPFATCELGGGIQVTHHRRPIIKPMDVYAISMTALGSGNNLPGYYMYHGGTNKIGKNTFLSETKDTGYPNDYTALSYDFQAPISEYGEIRDSYRLLNLIHLFVQDFGETFAGMEAVEPVQMVKRDDTTSLRYMMRCDGSSGYVFINHYQRLDHLEEIQDAGIEACGVEFPPLTITGDVSFFLPFRMKLGDSILRYATAQPLCKENNTYYFVEIPGIPAEYVFETKGKEEIEIVTLSFEDAKYLRKLNGKVFLTPGFDTYLMDGQMRQVPDLNWEKEHGQTVIPCAFTLKSCAPAFALSCPYEMNIGGERKQSWYEMELLDMQKEDTKKTDVFWNAYIEIKEPCDAAQIYADGVLVADTFYYGKPWRIPKKLLQGKKCYLVTAEMKHDFYKEYE